MARPLPIYPLKVPSYLFMPQAPGGVLPKGYGVIGSVGRSIATAWQSLGLGTTVPCTVHPPTVYRERSPALLCIFLQRGPTNSLRTTVSSSVDTRLRHRGSQGPRSPARHRPYDVHHPSAKADCGKRLRLRDSYARVAYVPRWLHTKLCLSKTGSPMWRRSDNSISVKADH